MKFDTIESRLDDDLDKNKVQYFFSILGPRFDVMNELMANSLEKRFGSEFRAIKILSARPNDHYSRENYIVINDNAKIVESELRDEIIYQQEYEDLNVEFLRSDLIKKIIKKLQKKQEKTFVYPFTTSFLKNGIMGLTIIGPSPKVSTYYDDKIKHHELFAKLDLPRNAVKVFKNKNDLIKNYKKFLPCYISAAYTSGGNESGLIYDKLMLNKFFGGLRDVNIKNNKFLAAKIFERIIMSPNVNSIVIAPGVTKVLVITDQIMSGNVYLGNIYPLDAPLKVHREIVRITERIGSYLSKSGYRGVFGLDFLVNKKWEVVVVDLNPRRQGGYACNALALKESGIELTDLELACALNEEVEQIPSYNKITYPKIWAHMKMKPHNPGNRIRKEIVSSNIVLKNIFNKKKGSFRSTFFKRYSMFVAGYIGFAVVVGNNREKVMKELVHMINTTLERCLL